ARLACPHAAHMRACSRWMRRSAAAARRTACHAADGRWMSWLAVSTFSWWLARPGRGGEVRHRIGRAGLAGAGDEGGRDGGGGKGEGPADGECVVEADGQRHRGPLASVQQGSGARG